MEFLEGRVFGKVNILDKVKGNLFRKPCKLLHFFLKLSFLTVLQSQRGLREYTYSVSYLGLAELGAL